jgi:class 3 adenylate cyclase
LAELYPDVTIFMADIAGFTAWSSQREPQQIFSFLEQVFALFDVAAKQRKVFKVETIGDSYVACTGAPFAQEDHAVRMCMFAMDISEEFLIFIEELALRFGPDTTDLGLRCGIHSGMVTMGVLRNERARFQLFGDCVNTTSRLESTSLTGRVQLSRETADLLLAAGKASWVTPREESVFAKGKGVLDTYWLRVNEDRGADADRRSNTRSNTGSHTGSAWSRSNELSSSRHGNETMSSGQVRDKLVEFNTQSLLKLLKRIVAHRKGIKTSALLAAGQAFGLPQDQTFTNEVAEIIYLPRSDNTTKESLSAGYAHIHIPEKVVSELGSLVQKIASLYNETNPFHNFQHASHVTMSILKLLSRIVRPSHGDDFDPADHSYGITCDPLTHFACAFVGLVHDADHPGVSNSQLLKENLDLGERFHKKSIAEQNSLSLCFDLLAGDAFANLRRTLFANEGDQRRFRQIVVNCVMATDIFDPDLKMLRNGRWNTAFAECHQEEPAEDTMNRKATIVLEHLIQASDVAHTMQHWKVYRKWNERLLEEMYTAYIAGRMEIDPTQNWAKGEIGFFDFYIIPLAKKLKDCGVFGVSSDEYLNYALINRKKWQEEGDTITADLVARLKASAASM